MAKGKQHRSTGLPPRHGGYRPAPPETPLTGPPVPPAGPGAGSRSKDAATRAADAQKAADDLRAATREAREALADLGAIEKRLRTLKAEVEEAAGTIFAERMEAQVKASMEEWNERTQLAIAQTEVAIDARFDTITSILLGEGKREGPTIAEMAQQVRDKMEADRGEPT